MQYETPDAPCYTVRRRKRIIQLSPFFATDTS